MRMSTFGTPADGSGTTLETAQAAQEQRAIGGVREMKTDFSLLIGVANAFVFQAIVFIAIFVVWYGAESLYAAALAN